MIHIASVAELGKALSVKRDKSEDDIEIVTAKITIARLFIHRETIDELLPMPVGWSARTLFDAQGAPLFKASLDLGKAEWTVAGQLSGRDDETALSLSDGTLHGVVLTLDKLGAFLSGSVSWAAAGDEVEDLADLLGRDVRVVLTLDDGGQEDLFAPLRRMAERDGISSVSIEVGGETVFSHQKPQQVQKVAELIDLLDGGWRLYCTGPAQYRLRKDGEAERHIWVNAVTSLMRRRELIENDDGELVDARAAA